MSNSILNYRHSIRLNDYDYSLEGAYFVTIITFQRVCLFGGISNGIIKLNSSGGIAFEQWMNLGTRFLLCDFSSFVVMPNHVHGIVVIDNNIGEESQISGDQNPCK